MTKYISLMPEQLLTDSASAHSEQIFPLREWTPQTIKGLLALEYRVGIRLEEVWEIMWRAGLIDDKDFYSGGPCHESLSRAAAKANELNRPRHIPCPILTGLSGPLFGDPK